MRPRFSTHISRTCGGTENPRFLRKFQICGLITLLLDIGSLARGAKIHSHPQILTKKWPKKGGFWGFLGGGPDGGVQRGGVGGWGFTQGPPFLRFKSISKTPVFAKRAIFRDFCHFWPFWAILAIFGGFWGFLGVLGGYPKVAKSGQKGGFLGGSKKGSKSGFPRIPRLNFGFFWKAKKCSIFGDFLIFLVFRIFYFQL